MARLSQFESKHNRSMSKNIILRNKACRVSKKRVTNDWETGYVKFKEVLSVYYQHFWPFLPFNFERSELSDTIKLDHF